MIIGVIRGSGHANGAGFLNDLTRLAGQGARIVVIGKLDPAYSDPRLTVKGANSRSEIADLAERYGVSRWFIPSIWPETFSSSPVNFR